MRCLFIFSMGIHIITTNDPGFFVDEISQSSKLDLELDKFLRKLGEETQQDLGGMLNGIFVVFQLQKDMFEGDKTDTLDEKYIFGYFRLDSPYDCANKFLQGDIDSLKTALTAYLAYDDVCGFAPKDPGSESRLVMYRDKDAANNEERVILTDEYSLDIVKSTVNKPESLEKELALEGGI